MASHGIRDKVAIVGMGCTPFAEHWDRSTDDLLIESATDALGSAGVALDDVDAFWLGTMGSGLSGLTLSRPLKIQHKPVTHVENFCATGSEAFRNACDRFTYLEVIDEPAAESPSDSGGRVLSPKLRGDTKLVSGLRASVTAASGEDGWANLAAVGNLMRNQQPDFDSRNWGYTKLSDLVRATELFVVETRPTGGLHVKDRRKASV